MGVAKPPFRIWIWLILFGVCYVTYTMQFNIEQSLAYLTQSKFLENDIKNHSDVEVWSSTVLQQIYLSYFYGIIISSAPSGFISEWYGPCNTIMYTLILIVFTNSLCVRAAEWHFAALIVCRIILGMLSGAILPALQVLISNWSPPSEKGKFTSLLMAGTSMGVLVSFTCIAPISKNYGWEWGFHFLSIQAAIVCLIFGLFVSNSPAEHKWISPDEKMYLKKSQGNTISNIKAFPPYLTLFKSLPFWALCIGHIGYMFVFYFCLIAVDKRVMLGALPLLEIDKGFIATLIILFLLVIIVGIGTGFIDDILKVSRPSRRTLIRRLWTLTSHILPGGLYLVLACLIGKTDEYNIILFGMAFVLSGTAVGTTLQNVHDFAPNYAGSIYGIINSIGGFAAIILLLTDENAWILSMLSAIMIATGLIYALLVSGEIQPWNSKLGQRLEEQVPIRAENVNGDENETPAVEN